MAIGAVPSVSSGAPSKWSLASNRAKGRSHFGRSGSRSMSTYQL